MATRILKEFFTLFVAAVFVAVLTGCAGAGTKTGQFVDDSAITTKVKAEFAKDKTVSATNVHVETSKGGVRLSGFVKSDTEKRRAEELARSVSGVTSVSSALVIRSD